MSYSRDLSYADRKKLMALINDFGSAKYWLADAVHQDPDTIDKRVQEADDAHQAILDFLYPDAKDYGEDPPTHKATAPEPQFGGTTGVLDVAGATTDEDPPTVEKTDDGPRAAAGMAADHSPAT